MQNIDDFNARIAGLNGVTKGILIGVIIGVLAGTIGLGIALVGPLYMFAGVIGLLVGLYVLTDLDAALYVVIAVIGLIPFGTLPFKIGVTPSLLDVALAAFFMVYVFQWMTGRRQFFRMTPVHFLVVIFALILMFSFVLGMAHAPLQKNILKQFAEMLLAIGLALILPDVIRDERSLRRVMWVVFLMAGMTAAIGIGLYILPDTLAERLLVQLARFGYPGGGVIRYIEDNPALAERAIGVWVDPNAYGGVLAVLGAVVAPQIFARRPLGGRRWVFVGIEGLIVLAVLLTFSRGALLSLGMALGFLAVLRYRKLLWVMLAGVVLLMILPITQAYMLRMIEGFLFADQATQMRVGEITDALRLISRYPWFGVGFLGTPTRDVYLGVANLYLTMAGNTGFLGLFTYLITVAGAFVYGLMAWFRLDRMGHFESFWLGAYAGIVAALVAGIFDHYFFKLEFQGSGTLFWVIFGLALAITRLWLAAEPGDS